MAPKKGSLEIYGNKITMNLNTMLYQNILASRYFKEDLFNLKTYHEVVDEIYNQVTDLEPFMPGNFNQPSSSFCLLYKLFTMRLTEKQLYGLLNHKDSPYIRALGFLYVRYALHPSKYWYYFKEYMYDYEPIKIAWAQNSKESTIGQFCRQLLEDQKYFSTILPRIPVAIAKDMEKKIQENPWIVEGEENYEKLEENIEESVSVSENTSRSSTHDQNRDYEKYHSHRRHRSHERYRKSRSISRDQKPRKLSSRDSYYDRRRD